MSKENYQWLEKELPSWVKEGIVTHEGANTLLRRYEGEKSSHRSSGIAFSLLGFILVGLGIISILAYNWDELGHIERTLLALCLLVSSQMFSFWVKRYRADDNALLEGSGVFWFLMIGASLAIIGQTYHLGGNLNDFLSIWLLLSFVLPWLLPSSGAAFLVIVLWSVVWVSNRSPFTTIIDLHTDSFLSPWLLMMIALSWVAYYGVQLKHKKMANTTLLLSWAVALCLFLLFIVEVVIETYEMRHLRNALICLALFFTIYYMLGKLYLSHGEKTWQRPFERIGKLGALLLLLFHVSFKSYQWMIEKPLVESNLGSILSITLGVLFIGLLVLFVRAYKRILSEALVVATPFIFTIYTLLQNQTATSHYAAMFFINFSLLLGASWMIFCGAKESKIGLINQGMILIALTIWIHFMDANFDLIAKGVAFIVTGMLFLVVNAFIRRRFKVEA